MKKRTYLMLAALAMFAGASMSPNAASANTELEVIGEEGAAKQQCYHYSWESSTTCSTCSNTCLGGNYKCCTISAG